MRFHIDIETGPLPDEQLALLAPPAPIIPDLPPFDPGSVATGNLKDAAKIAAKIADAQAAHELAILNLPALRESKKLEAFNSLKAGAALTALYGRPLLIVVSDGDTVQPIHDDNERVMLEAFWSAMSGFSTDDQFCGFNIRMFDLPFLIRRSMINRVKVPRFVVADMLSYRPRCIIDVRDYWQLGDRQALGSLDAICAAFNIHVKSNPEISGKNFAEAWHAGRKDECIAYCIEDVTATAELADRMGI